MPLGFKTSEDSPYNAFGDFCLSKIEGLNATLMRDLGKAMDISHCFPLRFEEQEATLIRNWGRT